MEINKMSAMACKLFDNVDDIIKNGFGPYYRIPDWKKPKNKGIYRVK